MMSAQELRAHIEVYDFGREAGLYLYTETHRGVVDGSGNLHMVPTEEGQRFEPTIRFGATADVRAALVKMLEPDLAARSQEHGRVEGAARAGAGRDQVPARDRTLPRSEDVTKTLPRRPVVHKLKECFGRKTALTKCGLTVKYQPGVTVTIWEGNMTCGRCAHGKRQEAG